MASKEYQIALDIYAKMDNSVTQASKLTKKQLQAIAKEVQATNAATSTIASSYVSAYDKINPALDKIESAGKKVFSAVATGAAVAGTAVAGISAYAINVGSSFESQMSTVQAITGASGDDFQDLTDKAKELGETTKYTATEVGEAMQYMGMAGWDTEQILAGISGVMDLAAASGEDLATVSDIVTDDMTAFGINLKDMDTDEAEKAVEHFTDVLAATATSTNTDVEMMGETFKYAGSLAGALGYSIDDVAVATGLMANSGIKAESAGTALRSLFKRMSAPTKQSQQAMDDLGLSLTDSQGNMKSFMEVMEEMRDSFSGLSETEKTQYASMLAGTEGMTGLLAIVNASEQDFTDAAEAVDQCAGATEEMANIKMDNLQGDVDIFKSALEGLGIEIYDQANGSLRDAVQTGTDLISMINTELKESNWVSNFCSTVEDKFPTVIRIVKQTASGVKDFTAPIRDFGDWCLDHPDAISSVLTGIVNGFLALKAGSLLSKTVSGFAALGGVLGSPMAAGILAVAGAIGGATGIASAIKRCRKQLDDADLAEHFGDIKLSIEDLQEATEQILNTTDFDALDEFSDAADKVDEYQQQINDSVEELNKLNWKVSIGIELSEDEQQQYTDSIDEYISGMEDSLEQQQYTVHVGMSILFEDDPEGQALIDQTDTYFAGEEEELAALGKELQSYINEAFDDGLLTIDESKHISELQQQMADIENALTESNFKAKIQAASLDVSGQQLDAETFQNLQTEISDYIDEAQQKYAEAREQSLAALASQYAEGGFESEDAYNQAVQEVQNAYIDRMSELQSQGSTFELNAIYDAYGDEISQAAQAYNTQIESVMNQYGDDDMKSWWENNQGGHAWESMVNDIGDSGLSQEAKDNINTLLDSMQPTIDQMQELADQCEAAGKAVPENIAKGLEDVQNLRALTGSRDAIKTEIGERIADHSELDSMLQETGNSLPDQVAEGVDQNKDVVDESCEQIWGEAEDKLQALAAEGVDVDTTVRVHATVDTPSSYEMSGIMYGFSSNQRSSSSASSSSSSSKTTSKTKVKNNALGGIYEHEILTTVAEKGPEAIIPLDGSARSVQLYEMAGEALGFYTVQDGNTNNVESYQIQRNDAGGIYSSEILTTVAESGPEAIIPLDGSRRAIQLWTQAGNRIANTTTGYNNQENTATGYNNRIIEYDNRTANSRANSIANNTANDWTSGVTDVQEILQNGGPGSTYEISTFGGVQNYANAPVFDASTIQAYEQTTDARTFNAERNSREKVAFHADGGIFDQAHIGIVAEAGPEAVIPLDGSDNSIQLWTKAGEQIGAIDAAENQESTTTNNTSIRNYRAITDLQNMIDTGEGPAIDTSGIRKIASGGGGNGSTTSETNDNSSYVFNFNPTYQFYGEAPSRDDMVEAAHMSQDEFNSMMERWIRDNKRVAF